MSCDTPPVVRSPIAHLLRARSALLPFGFQHYDGMESFPLYPGPDVVPLVTTPYPPTFEEFGEPNGWGWMFIHTLRSAWVRNSERHATKLPKALREPDQKVLNLVQYTCEKLASRGIRAGSWILWGIDYWKECGSPSKVPQPVWFFSGDIIDRIALFEASGGRIHYMPQRVTTCPLHRELVVVWESCYRLVASGVRKEFPQNWEARVDLARMQSQGENLRLQLQARRGDFLW